jgi:HD-GYP domain-containing protein (c-di-GMP phosphodiesterase class II)
LTLGKLANPDIRRKTRMSGTHVLLSRIAALRQQLEQAQDQSRDGEPTATSPPQQHDGPHSRLWQLEQQVTNGSRQTVLLNRTLHPLSSGGSPQEEVVLPRQLTASARRLLEHGRKLLHQLRSLADALDRTVDTVARKLDPLADYYHATTAMADTTLRMVQAFPDAPTAQLRLCQGLEKILEVIDQRVETINFAVEERRQQTAQVDQLADLLRALHGGRLMDLKPLVLLAELVLDEVEREMPLRFLTADPADATRSVACHSLSVANVVARVVQHDPEFRGKSLEPVLAALVHDVGMLSVPSSILTKVGPLDDDQRRAVEIHTQIGAEIMTRLLPGGSWLAEAVGGHHERLDGTGYPGGLRQMEISSLCRLLAVCDVYTALASARPHRPALDTRTALADTLLLAEQGTLDRYHAERLLQLSFYPVGSVVELADGAVGLVVATHLGRRELSTPARPVVALLTDSQGRLLPAARHVDLAQCESRSITRTVPAGERRELLGKRYPDLV